MEGASTGATSAMIGSSAELRSGAPRTGAVEIARYGAGRENTDMTRGSRSGRGRAPGVLAGRTARISAGAVPPGGEPATAGVMLPAQSRAGSVDISGEAGRIMGAARPRASRSFRFVLARPPGSE